MPELKVIRNATGVAQSIVYQGRQITLAGYAEEKMPVDLADAFLLRCAPTVEEATLEADPIYDPEGDDNIWIANVTGHPNYPREINSKSLQNKKWVHTKVPNPSSIWHPVVREYDAGQEAYTGRDGSYMTRNLPKVPLEIRPFQRKVFKRGVGEWFLRREGNSTRLSGFSPAAIKSRKPTAYEPDVSWSLDEIRGFLKIASSNQANLGPSEADLVALTKENSWNSNQISAELNKLKKAAVETAWYYVVDPKYRLPTKVEVKELLSGKSSVEIHDDQVDRIMDAATV